MGGTNGMKPNVQESVACTALQSNLRKFTFTATRKCRGDPGHCGCILPDLLQPTTMHQPTPLEIDAGIQIADSEGVISISLLQRRLRMGYTRARALVDELGRRGILGDVNPFGLFHVHPSRFTPLEVPARPEVTHARLIHDLAWYLVEYQDDKHTECVYMLAQGLARYSKIRPALPATIGTESNDGLLPRVAAAISRMPEFSSKVPADLIEQDLLLACSSSEIRPLASDPELSRWRGVYFACRYLKRRLMEGENPHTRALEFFTHRYPAGMGKGRVLNGKGHREHVVPLKALSMKAYELLKAGLSEQAVAQWIEPYVRVVIIDKADAARLDHGMRLKTAMPPGWKFGRDCMYARLHEADIQFDAPAEGPWCSCGASRVRLAREG